VVNVVNVGRLVSLVSDECVILRNSVMCLSVGFKVGEILR